MFASFSIDHASEESKKDAKQQLLIILAISFLPLVVGFAGIAIFGNDFNRANIWQGFRSVFLSGELYFYAISSCASIAFLSSVSEHRSNRGMRLWSLVFIVFCAAFMAFYVGQGDARNVNAHGLVSLIFLITAIFLYYRVIVLSQQPPPMPEDENRKKASELASKLEVNYD